MGYLQDLEKELRDRFAEMDEEKLIKFFKEKVLESYRNGAQVAKPARGKGRFPYGRVKGYRER